MMRNFIKQLGSLFSTLLLGGFLLSSAFASIAFNDAKSLNFTSGTVTLYMGQNGSSFYLDAVAIGGRPLSCEIKAGTTLNQRSNCDDVSFSYNGNSSDIKIYVQYDNDQGTFIYNTSSQTFTSAVRGMQDVTDNNPPINNQGYLSVSTNTSSVKINDYLSLMVRMYDTNGNTDTANRDTVRISLLKQSGNGYYTASSSDYYLKNMNYKFTSSDRGYVTLDNYVRFYTSGTYKIVVENLTTNRSSDIVISVGNTGGSSSTRTESFGVDTNIASPSLNQYIDTTITARDNNGNRTYDYRGTVNLVVEKKNSGSNFWSSAPSSDYTLSSSSIYLGASQQGTVFLSNNLRFLSSGNYRLRVYDTNNSSLNGYREFTVKTSGNNTQDNVYRYVATSFPIVPNLYDNIKINIIAKDSNNTTTSSPHSISIKLQRKLLPVSKNWTSVGVTRACRLNTNSYTFNSSDNGQVSIDNLVRCTKKGFYRVVIMNNNNNKVLGYSYFTVLDTNDFVSSLYGFTPTQRQEVQEEYRTFMSQVNARESQYPRLSYNSKWDTLWKNYYNVLNKLAYNKPGRVPNYSSYETARTNFNNSLSNMR